MSTADPSSLVLSHNGRRLRCSRSQKVSHKASGSGEGLAGGGYRSVMPCDRLRRGCPCRGAVWLWAEWCPCGGVSYWRALSSLQAKCWQMTAPPQSHVIHHQADWGTYAAPQSQKAVAAHLKSEQLLPFGLAPRYIPTSCVSQWNGDRKTRTQQQQIDMAVQQQLQHHL